MHDCSGPTDSHWDSAQWANQYLLRKLLLRPPRLPIYVLARKLAKIVISAFFGEVQILGVERIPYDGPVIFVGNHNNQFVDAFLMMAAIPRKIKFLIAAVSMKIPVIGMFASLVGAIEVNRPQDLKFTGMGKLDALYRLDSIPSDIIKNVSNTFEQTRNDLLSEPNLWLIVGNCNTRFRLDCKLGDRLSYSNAISTHAIEPIEITDLPRPGRTLLVRSICSDNHMLVELEAEKQRLVVEKGLRRLEGVSVCEREIEEEATITPSSQKDRPSASSPFSVFPKMDQGMVYEKVSRVLASGDCICIFPEGGSHDRPDLLPLKPGVALFALQAYIAGVRDALIVPVGLHYFDRQRVGSAAVVDIGRPIAVTKDMAQKFALGGKDKQAAVNDLLSTVRKELQAVTITAESYHILQTIQRCSEVYLPLRFQPTSEVKHKLQAVFNTIFELAHSLDPALIEQADVYSKLLDTRGLQDASVLRMTRYTWQKHREAMLMGVDWPDNNADSAHLYCALIIKSLSLAVCFAFAWPALIISMPLRHLASVKSSAAAEASSVKIAGVDVLASAKIQLFLTCIPGAAIVAALVGAMASSHRPAQLLCLFPFYLLATSVVIYYGLQLTTTVTNLTKQVQCYYTMCLSQASALEGAGIDLIAERNELQRMVRENVKKALVALTGAEGSAEPQAALEAICPQYLVDLDTSERLLNDNAFTMSPSIYKAMMSTRDEII